MCLQGLLVFTWGNCDRNSMPPFKCTTTAYYFVIPLHCDVHGVKKIGLCNRYFLMRFYISKNINFSLSSANKAKRVNWSATSIEISSDQDFHY